MTKPITFSVCDLKRVLKAAHSLQLPVHGFEVQENGRIRVFTAPLGDRPEEPTPAEAA